MRAVYEAEHSLDANLIANILRQAGIRAHIAGEYLQGAAGELPAFGLIRVLVDNQDVEHARLLIDEWNSATPLAE
ncbi:hypothetical protein MTYP_00282 [Methylophilaceae bacterium]|nr:hypothetical protein MTYP_00282 [Methylophilaceae bacterium]